MQFTKKFTFAAVAFAAAITLSSCPGKKGPPLEKTETMRVEPISLIRSQDTSPEVGAPVASDGRILVASSRKKVVTYDYSGVKTGEAGLSFEPVATPAVDGNAIYAGAGDGKFHAADFITGEDLWDYELKTIGFSPATVYKDIVIFQTASDRLVALDKNTGEWRWEYQHLRVYDLSVKGLARPVVSDGFIYVGFSGGSVAKFEADTGAGIWKTRAFTGEQFVDVNTPVEVDETSVYCVSVDGRVAALSKKTGNIFWEYSAGGMAGGRLQGDDIYIATDHSELFSIDKVTGVPGWITDYDDSPETAFRDYPLRPVVLGDYIAVVSRWGEVIAFDRASGDIAYRRHYHTDTYSEPVMLDEESFVFIDNKGIVRIFRLTGAVIPAAAESPDVTPEKTPAGDVDETETTGEETPEFDNDEIEVLDSSTSDSGVLGGPSEAPAEEEGD